MVTMAPDGTGNHLLPRFPTPYWHGRYYSYGVGSCWEFCWSNDDDEYVWVRLIK